MSPSANKMVCEQCGKPADHAECWNNKLGYRAWCEAHTPWSGHYEYCPDHCRRMRGLPPPPKYPPFCPPPSFERRMYAGQVPVSSEPPATPVAMVGLFGERARRMEAEMHVERLESHVRNVEGAARGVRQELAAAKRGPAAAIAPGDWSPSPAAIAFCDKHKLDIAPELEIFRDYVSQRQSAPADMDEAFDLWLRCHLAHAGCGEDHSSVLTLYRESATENGWKWDATAPIPSALYAVWNNGVARGREHWRDRVREMATARARLETSLRQEQDRVVELRRQIEIQGDNNARRNRELDALHYVWCSGGCEGGVHRFTHPAGGLTEEIVAEAERLVARMRQWLTTKAKRAEQP